jgi:hypothetical protein
MPPISAPVNTKSTPSTCRQGAGSPVSALSWSGEASAKPPPRNPFLQVSEPLFGLSCAPIVKINLLAILPRQSVHTKAARTSADIT